MSFWGNLAKIGGFAAAPFTGGASIPIGMAVGNSIGAAAGGAAQGMANNRGVKASVMMDQNSALERELLAREEEKRAARNDAYKNAQRGAIAYNWQPQQGPPGIPHFDVTGGTMGTPQAKAAGDEMLKQSMNRMTQPDLQTPGGMPAYRNLANDKDFNKAMNPGLWEKIAGIAAVGAPIAGGIFSGGGGNTGFTGGKQMSAAPPWWNSSMGD